jgi:hypothetical protein
MHGVQLSLLEQMMTWRIAHNDWVLANTTIRAEGVHTWSDPRP